MDYTYTLSTLPKSVTSALITIPWEIISREYDVAFDKLSEELEVEGYRRGKAPKALEKKHIKQEKVYDKLVRILFTRLYEEIVKKEDLKPIVAPRIDIKTAKENEPWEVEMQIAQKPTVDLSRYKKAVEELKKSKKGDEIWTPGKETSPANSSDSAKKQQLLNEILAVLLKEIPFEVADMVIEEEVESRLTRLVDDVQKVGMTIEAYAKSKNTTIEEIRAQIQREVDEMYKLEFILNEIADAQNIQVEQAEMDALIGNAKDEKEKEAAAKNMYFYVMILRKQKVLDYLLAL